MSLFRDEVLRQRTESLHGVISLAVPMSWRLISISLAAIIVIGVIFLATASYSRTEIASGSVLPTGGIVQVIPSRAGLVENITVQEGRFVRRGAPLAWIRADEADRSGTAKQVAILSAIERQQRGLEDQQESSRAASVSEQGEYAAQIAGLQAEIRSVGAQIAVEQRLVDMAQSDLTQASQIASRGFISRRDLAVREETLLSRQQQLSVLQQTRAAKLSSVMQAERARSQAAAKASGASAVLATSRAQIERERATSHGEEGYLLVAPTQGRVAALNIHVGDAVNTQDATMAIVPSNGRLVARIYVPGKAAGFIRTNQSVRLALDAYPYERFGTVDGTISVLSSAPVMKTDKDGVSSPFYIATATIARPFVKAYGKRQTLLPGMTFTARIVVEKRSLLQWLFDPLFAATR